ncbi:transposase-like protein [Rhizobium mongolense]|uniref:Transposase-like protein n=1 Tax=Rhizobium mongolense TaxID=57676 RepID=A0A7W6RTS6_9HYPH|nr:transposase-like protein [Rhizobium mongolense]
MQRRKFSREYKLEAVKLISARGVSVAQAARDLVSCANGSRNTVPIRHRPFPAMGR